MNPAIFVLVFVILVVVTILLLYPPPVSFAGRAQRMQSRPPLDLLQRAAQEEKSGDLRAAFDTARQALRYRGLERPEIRSFNEAALQEIEGIYRRLGWPLSPLQEARRRLQDLVRLDHPMPFPPGDAILTDPAEDARIHFEAAVSMLPEPPPPPPSQIPAGPSPSLIPTAFAHARHPSAVAFLGDVPVVLEIDALSLFTPQGTVKQRIPLPGARALCASPDGMLAAQGRGEILILDGPDSLRRVRAQGMLLALSPRGQLLAMRTPREELRLFSAKGENVDQLPTTEVTRALFTPKGALLVGTRWGAVEIFDPASGTRQGTLSSRAQAERVPVTSLLWFTPDKLAVGSANAFVDLYDLETLAWIEGFPAGRPHPSPYDELDAVRGLAFAGGFVVSGLASGLLAFFRPEPLQFGAYLAPATWHPVGPPLPRLLSLAGNASGQQVAAVFDDGLIAFFAP